MKLSRGVPGAAAAITSKNREISSGSDPDGKRNNNEDHGYNK